MLAEPSTRSCQHSKLFTHLPVDGEEDEPLTPNLFLIGGTNSTQTPGPTVSLYKEAMADRSRLEKSRLAKEIMNSCRN